MRVLIPSVLKPKQAEQFVLMNTGESPLKLQFKY